MLVLVVLTPVIGFCDRRGFFWAERVAVFVEEHFQKISHSAQLGGVENGGAENRAQAVGGVSESVSSKVAVGGARSMTAFLSLPVKLRGGWGSGAR